MRKVGFALAMFLMVGMMLGWQVGKVRAECSGTGDYCNDDEACAPEGWCGVAHCCYIPPEPPPPIGCTADYQCGSGNCCVNGACTSCGGGASDCPWRRVDCPGGSVRTNQVVSSICGRISYCPGPGSAQVDDGCCRTGGGQTTCGDWYPCPKPNNPNKMCRDCETEEEYCVAKTIITYRCELICTATAPTNLSVVQRESATSANVSWSVGSGGVSQRLYVDQSASEVDAGCPTANACEVKATLSSSTTSYPVTGLLPSTAYYFRVETYKNSSCHPGVRRRYTTPAVTLSGRVYLDSNNNCSTATPWNLGGLTVSVRGTLYSGSVGGDFA